jgi:hypothetical protein
MEEKSTLSVSFGTDTSLINRWSVSRQLIDLGEPIERIDQIQNTVLCLLESHELVDPTREGSLLTGVRDFVCGDDFVVVCREAEEGKFRVQRFAWSNLVDPLAESALFDEEVTNLCIDRLSSNAAALLGDGQVVCWNFELNALDQLTPLEDPLLGLIYTSQHDLVVGIGALGGGYKMWQGVSWSEKNTDEYDPISTTWCTLWDDRIVSLSEDQLLVGEKVLAEFAPLHGVLHIQPVPMESRFVVLEDSGQLTVWSAEGDESIVLRKGTGRFVADQLSVGNLVAFVLEGTKLCLLGHLSDASS